MGAAHGDRPGAGAALAKVEVYPQQAIRRTLASWSGVAAETAQFVGTEPFEYHFGGTSHLLVACQRAVRHAGETRIGASLTSSRRDIGGTLCLVPAGEMFHGTFVPKVAPRTNYIYIEPSLSAHDSDVRSRAPNLRPRLFFQSASVWPTAMKLAALVDDPGTNSRLYADTLALLLTVELQRLEDGHTTTRRIAGGGLAPWQVQRVRDFIEENLAQDIPLATLAELVALSPAHFCRVFKQSTGLSPHRYQLHRRMERAKVLLADADRPVGAIALECGYDLPSSFATKFRKVTGATPSSFRRSLQ
jgi:AraC family transcriptional regulator